MACILFLLVSNTCSFFSENGQYQVCATFYGGVVFKAKDFSLRAQEETVYRVDEPGVYTFFVSNHGTVFALSEHHAVFYSRTGECDTLVQFTFLNNSGFSELHDLFYVSVQEGIYVYTLDGNMLYQLMPGRLFASTRHGDTIAAVSADTLVVYIEGMPVHTKILETAYVRGVGFTESGSVRVEERGGIEVFDVNTGEKVEW